MQEEMMNGFEIETTPEQDLIFIFDKLDFLITILNKKEVIIAENGRN
tara:strand:+ start:505 stop:645 length:141 start_codon:yes stop_codon:yes gene_type:complete